MASLISQIISDIEGGSLTLQAPIVSGPAATALQEAMLVQEALTIDTSDATHSQPTTDSVLVKNATVKGSVKLLNIPAPSVSFTLTVDFYYDTSSGNNFILKVSLPANWSVAQSFPELANIFPFSQLNIGSNEASFYYTNQDQTTNPLGKPATLSEGGNFYVKGLTGFTLIQNYFIDLGVSSTLDELELYGAFQPKDGNPYPVVDLHATLDTTGGKPLKVKTPLGTDLSLTSPSLHFQITPPKDKVQNFSLSVETTLQGLGSDGLDISLQLSETDNQITITANPAPDSNYGVADIESLIPGAASFTSMLPADINADLFQTIQLTTFQLQLDIKENTLTSLNLSLAGLKGTGHSATPATYEILNLIEVQNLTFDFNKLNVSGTVQDTVKLSGKSHVLAKSGDPAKYLFPGHFDFELDLDNSSGSWAFSEIDAHYYGDVLLSDIVDAMDTGASSCLSASFKTLTFSDFYLDVDQTNKKWDCGTNVEFTLTLDDVNFFSTSALTFSETKAATAGDPPTKDWEVKGQLMIGDDYVLNYDIDKSGDGTTFNATAKDNTPPLGLNTLLQTLGFQEEIPANLDVDLTSVSFTYEESGDDKKFFFTCTSATYGTVQLAKTSKGICVYFESSFSISSGQMPLVGSKLKGLIAFDDLGLILITQDSQASDFNDSTSGFQLPSNMVALTKGVYLTATVKLPGTSLPVQGLVYEFGQTRKVGLSGHKFNPNLSGDGGSDNGANGGGSDGGNGAGSGASTASSSGSSKVFTIPINKKLGPIDLDSLGISYENDDLNIIFNASLAMGPLSMGFEDLEIGSPLSHFDPHGSLKGLSLGYHTDDVTIEGAFLHENDEYLGEFTLSLTKLQLSALGAYSSNDGNPSIFIYGVLDEPLGGPAFMFVDGLAVGFGYNRAFIPPPVTDVSTFPLITAAQKVNIDSVSPTDLNKQFKELSQYIPPKDGEYFIGVGIKFMSFKVINSFALLIAEFGKELEFDLLGVSTYVAPDPKDPNPTASVELELIGTYNPAVGSLIVRGQLTPDSYVLSKKCHLQGGFAIAFWTKSGQPHDGEFVFCFGGYGNHYTPKPYYPQGVPQLQFLWQVNSQVSIKGGGYWALTPKEIVAGGFLQALYQNGWVKASFDANAYFLIHWSPLYYKAGFTVSFSLSVKVDLLFCSTWLGFEISEQLRLHGPPFGGAAGISLWVCTVWIHFGAQPGAAPLLSWADFSKKHLPEPATGQETPQVLSIDIEKGMLKREKSMSHPGDYVYFINPKELYITTNSVVPSTKFVTPSNTTGVSGTPFTIKPTGEDFVENPGGGAITGNYSTHTITFSGTDADTELTCTVADPKPAPSSMWFDTASTTPVSNVTPLVFGTNITPTTPTKADRTSSVPRSELMDQMVNAPGFGWEVASEFRGTSESATACAAALTEEGDISSDTFSDLEGIFSFSGSSNTDFSGLHHRINKMGKTKLSIGTLEQAS